MTPESSSQNRSAAFDAIASAAPEQLVATVDRAMADPAASSALAGACCDRLIELKMLADAEVVQRLQVGSPWRATAAGRRLTALVLEARRDWAAAVAAWTEVIDTAPGLDHEAILARAKSRAQTSDTAGAYADLRTAFAGVDDFAFSTRGAKLLRRLRKAGPPPALRRVKLAVLSSTTTVLSTPLLELALYRDGVDATIYEAPYGSFRQEILDPQSGLYRFAPDVVLIATHWRDADVPPLAEDAEPVAERVVGEFRMLWNRLLERVPCRVVQHGFDVPAHDSYGYLSHAQVGGRRAVLREINRRLVAAAPAAVAVLDLEQVAAQCGAAAWVDAAQWHLAKQHPGSRALPTLVDHQVAMVRAHLGLTKKVLVFDLDNTLWGGVIGEDGLEGIEVGPPSARGEAHAALQQYGKELKERGILLAVCSKNNDADARLPFERHDGMILRLDDFAAFRANWEDKPTNLRALANLLQLGLDSFVFLDDNPIERALVRRELPEVAVPELGPDPATYLETLDRMLYFETLSLSDEDLRRHQLYRENADRNELHQAAGSLDEFLRELKMESEMGPVDESNLARIVQLLGKTNQFNVTTRRHGEALVREMIASPRWWTRYFKLRDRFGDNGLVGVMIARHDDDERDVWEIDTWLMSCRVIGRKMEELMFRTLAEAARRSGATRLRGVFIPTPKNGLVADLFTRFGFHPAGTIGDAQQFDFDLVASALPDCDCIHVVEPARAN